MAGYDALPDLLGIPHELLIQEARRGSVRLAAESCALGADDEEAGLLELDGEEESRRRVDAPNGDTLLVSTARRDVVRPEGETCRIVLPVEEVVIVLPDEGGGV